MQTTFILSIRLSFARSKFACQSLLLVIVVISFIVATTRPIQLSIKVCSLVLQLCKHHARCIRCVLPRRSPKTTFRLLPYQTSQIHRTHRTRFIRSTRPLNSLSFLSSKPFGPHSEFKILRLGFKVWDFAFQVLSNMIHQRRRIPGAFHDIHFYSIRLFNLAVYCFFSLALALSVALSLSLSLSIFRLRERYGGWEVCCQTLSLPLHRSLPMFP